MADGHQRYLEKIVGGRQFGQPETTLNPCHCGKERCEGMYRRPYGDKEDAFGDQIEDNKTHIQKARELVANWRQRRIECRACGGPRCGT